MSLPRSAQWDIVDWDSSRIADSSEGLISQIGTVAEANRPGALAVEDDGAHRGVRLTSNDGLPSDYVLAVSIPRRFTLEYTATLQPPSGVTTDPSKVLAVGAQDRTGSAGLLFYGAGSTVAWLQVPPAGTTVPLGRAEATSAAAAIARGEPITVRMVVNGDTGVMNFYATPEAVILAGGVHVLRATVPAPVAPSGDIPAPRTMDYFSLYVRGTADNPSSIKLTEVRISSQLLEPVRRPAAVILYDTAGGVAERVVLDGTQSTDSGHRQLTYSWRVLRQPIGANVVLTGMQRASAALWPVTFTAVARGSAGNGIKVRIVGADAFSISTLAVPEEPIVVVVSVVVQSGLVVTRVTDVVEALTNPAAQSYSSAAACVLSAAASAGASDLEVLTLSTADLVLAGGADTVLPVVTFVPNVKGEYEFGLTVNNGILDSLEAVAAVRVGDTRLVTGFTPDASYLWTYLSDFWGVVRGREPIETFWSAFIQKTAGLLLDVAQTMDERSLSTFPQRRVQRWKPFTVRATLPGSTIFRAGPVLVSGYATSAQYEVSVPEGSILLLDPQAVFFPVEAALAGRWPVEAEVTYELQGGGAETRYGIVTAVSTAGGLVVSGIAFDPPADTVRIRYTVRSSVSPVGTSALPYPYDDTADELAASEAADFLTDRFWANGNSVAVGDMITYLGVLYTVTAVEQAVSPLLVTDTLCTVDRPTIPVYEILNDGNRSAKGSEDLGEEVAAGDPLDSTTAIVRTDYQTFSPPEDGTGLRLWLQGEGVPGKARELSSWSENELRLLREADELPCIRAFNFDSDMKIVSRLAGPQGNAWFVLVQFAGVAGVQISCLEDLHEVIVQAPPGSTVGDVIDALTIPGHPGYCAGADRVLEVFPRSDLPVTPGYYQLGGYAVSEHLVWKLLRRHDMRARRGLVVRFDPTEVYGREVASTAGTDLDVFEGDLIEFSDYGHVVAVATVLGVAPDALMVDQPVSVEDGQPLALSVTTRAASVVHRTRLRSEPDIVSVPFLQQDLEIDERLLHTADDPRLEEGVDYRLQGGWITSVTHEVNALRYGEPEAYIAAMRRVVETNATEDRLWAEVVVRDNDETLGSNFGVLVGFPREAFTQAGLSVSYLSAVKGVMFTLFHGPTRTNIRIGGQIFCNLPFVEERGEVTEVSLDFDLENQLSRVQVLSPPTDPDGLNEDQVLRSYTFPRRLGVEDHLTLGRPLAVGDVVEAFQPICKGVQVDDYISNPGWYRGHRLEVQKYHTFRVVIDSELTSASTVDLMSLFVKTIKPHWQDVSVGTLKTCVDERDLTDEVQHRVRVNLRDDRYTCEDEDVVGGYVQMFDDTDGGGSTWNADPTLPGQTPPRTQVDRPQHFDQRVGSNVVSSQVLGPPVVISSLGLEKGRWDHLCSDDGRQKNYFDRKLHRGPRSRPTVRVCTYMPQGPMYPYVLYDKPYVERSCTITAAGPGVYTLEDMTANFLDTNWTRMHAGSWVLVDPGSSAAYAAVTGIGATTLDLLASGVLPEGPGIVYRVLADYIGPAPVLESMALYGQPDGACPAYDSIFRYDVLKPGTPVPSQTMDLIGPASVCKRILNGVPNYDSGYYTWFDWKLVDWERDVNGDPVPGGEPPYVERVAAPGAPPQNESASPWQPNSDGFVVKNLVACTVVGVGNGVAPSELVLKNPAPVPLGVELL